SHQWFGDSVAPATWSDIWLNEGHATWYEMTWAAPRGYLATDTGLGANTLDGVMKRIYAAGDRYRSRFGPVALPQGPAYQFSNIACSGAALVLRAWRQRGGPAAFARLGRGWAQDNAGQPRSTDDFIASASRSPGQDLTGFLGAGPYGPHTPPMP